MESVWNVKTSWKSTVRDAQMFLLSAFPVTDGPAAGYRLVPDSGRFSGKELNFQGQGADSFPEGPNCFGTVRATCVQMTA